MQQSDKQSQWGRVQASLDILTKVFGLPSNSIKYGLNNPFPEGKKSYHTTPLQIAKESRHQNAQIDVATIYSLHILDMHIYTAIAIINYMPKEKEKGTGTYRQCLHFKTFILQ